MVHHGRVDTDDKRDRGSHILLESGGKDRDEDMLPPKGEDKGKEAFDGKSKDGLGLGHKYNLFLQKYALEDTDDGLKW